MVVIPALHPPLPRQNRWSRNIAPSMAFRWLALGWHDLCTRPLLSLAYGLLIFLVSEALVFSLFYLEWDYIMFPALAGFMVVGPILAVGLYEKSRRLAAGERVSLGNMLFPDARSGPQILFTGALLCLLMLVWMRAAVIVWALFFGLLPFPGLDHIVPVLFGTPVGWAMLIVGSAVGALFAAFSFAISVFSVPMLLDKPVDALTAMGSSVALVWNNLRVMLVWGAIVLALFLLCVVTGLAALVVVFPLLGHGSWHAYRSMEPAEPAS